jgi:hypothetical protein
MADGDAPWYFPNSASPPDSPSTKPRERVWSLRSSVRSGSRRIDCDLIGQGQYGWEVVVQKEGEWFYGQPCPTREGALFEAEEIRARYLRDGGVLLS